MGHLPFFFSLTWPCIDLCSPTLYVLRDEVPPAPRRAREIHRMSILVVVYLAGMILRIVALNHKLHNQLDCWEGRYAARIARAQIYAGLGGSAGRLSIIEQAPQRQHAVNTARGRYSAGARTKYFKNINLPFGLQKIYSSHKAVLPRINFVLTYGEKLLLYTPFKNFRNK